MPIELGSEVADPEAPRAEEVIVAVGDTEVVKGVFVEVVKL